MRKYTQECLINKLSISRLSDISFLLGAGCSISSGCMAAGKLVTEFKKRMYCAKYGLKLNDSTLLNDEKFIEIVNKEYPYNMKNPYSYYFESCFPNALDRAKFIKDCFLSISPSYGYLCFANYLIRNKIGIVLTTNFDNLIEKSIRKLNENYDITFQTDSLTPLQESALNIIKLHGDYNYDYIRNTETELKFLSDTINNSVIKAKYKTLIVLGYSGMDDSVMNSLHALSVQGVEIIWCSIDESCIQNNQIVSLLNNNQNSGYCLIQGFDDLFSKLYSFQNSNNEVIEEIYKKNSNSNFELMIVNQPEKMEFNANELISNPFCYRISASFTTKYIKEFNKQNLDCYILQYRDKLYIVGNKDKVINILDLPKSLLEEIYICDEPIPIFNKCRLIKEIIKIYFRSKNIGVFKDDLYLQSDSSIKEGLEISIDLFNGKICLLSNVNYFSDSIENNDSLKLQINKLKSDLYAITNYGKRNELFNKIFGNSLKIDLYNNNIEFDRCNLGNTKKELEIYNCSDEPEMVVDNNYSVNQIKLLNEFGPRNTLFSNKKIKVGIFCPSDDKKKLKAYLDLLVNGTKVKGKSNSIIPEYRGFSSVFKKQIEIEYNGLPNFYNSQLLNSSKVNAYSFKDFCIRGIKKLYDEKNVDIVLIYISNKLSIYRADDNFDLHDSIKLSCANKYKTQFIEEKSIDSYDDINKKIFNLAIGIYTKTIGMPWYPRYYSKDTLFLGMSFGRDARGITVGCSQMFDGAGRGMQLIVTQISDKQRKNQYLSLDEAYNLGVKIRTTYYKSSKIESLKRIVIHRCDPFKQEEIEGFKKAFEGIDDFDLIQISDYTQFNSFCFRNNKCSGYPVRRGTIVKNSRDTAYVWTDGSVVSTDILRGYTYRNNKRGIGKPIKIRKFYGNISINQVVDDLMYLTKMDFNSSDIIYSKYPVTIKYSQVVCKMLKQGNFDDDLISFEYIM